MNRVGLEREPGQGEAQASRAGSWGRAGRSEDARWLSAPWRAAAEPGLLPRVSPFPRCPLPQGSPPVLHVQGKGGELWCLLPGERLSLTPTNGSKRATSSFHPYCQHWHKIWVIGSTAFIRDLLFFHHGGDGFSTKWHLKKKKKINSLIISILEVILTVEVRRVLSAFQHHFLDDNVATAVWPAGELLSWKKNK